jgi:hypothetical protein
MIPVVVLVAFASATTAVALGFTFWPISIWSIHRHTKTWIGIGQHAARARIRGGQFTEETWQHGQFSGKIFVVVYKHHTLRLTFGAKERVIAASIHIFRDRSA